MNKMVAFTNCKINIGLDIVSERPDGYHDIVTVMKPIPWHDIIEIVPAKGDITTLTVLGNKVDCPPEKNLVMKAYEAMRVMFGLPPVDIILQKIIPDGAGLGGGSGDAATTLLMLNEMFNIGLSKAQLAEIAAKLGADCPFFIYDRTMLCTGTGTDMEPIDLELAGYSILIAKPQGVNVSTKQAYAGTTPHIPAIPLAERVLLPVTQWQGVVVNDFEPTVCALAPQITDVKRTMLEHGAAYASMSGSGAAVYGFFDDDNLALQAMEALSDCVTFKA